MKIGILTFHRAENFGAVLQCYALQRFLQQRGYDVEIIDYRNKNIENGYKLFTIRDSSLLIFLKSVIRSLLTFIIRCKKKISYKRFRLKYLNVSKKVYTDSSFSRDYDIIICGSDQIWNSRLTGGLDLCYFLGFKTAARKISYAASSELRDYHLLDNYKLELTNILKTFKGCSVREKKFADYLHDILNINFETVIDPTFLLEKNEYLKIAINPKTNKYVLVYNLTENESTIAYAKRLAKEKYLKLIIINAGIKPFYKKNVALDPRELLGYIANAEYIFTNSFHGLSLSLKLNKQVYVVKTDYTSRLEDLLSSLGLGNRILQSNISNFKESYLDYTQINNVIESKVTYSVKFLLDSIEL